MCGAGKGGGITLFNGDLFVSGTLVVSDSGRNHGGSISGSIHHTADGTSYLVAGAGVTIASASNGQVEISSSAAKTYSISCADGDNADEEKIRLSDNSSPAVTDDIILEAGTGLSIARAGDKITFTNTVTDSDTNTTYTVSAAQTGSPATNANPAIRLTDNASPAVNDDIVL